ncbi:hypothetical protein ACI65C_010281 [Semiaphis heraclei]
MNELDKRFNDTNNNIILTCTIFISSDPDYFNFKSPYLQAFLDHYNYFKINPIFLESEFLIAKNLLSKNKNNTREDGVHDLFSISKKFCIIYFSSCLIVKKLFDINYRKEQITINIKIIRATS